MAKSGNHSAAAPPTGHRRRRFLFRGVLALVLLLCVVLTALFIWGAVDYYGKPEALLPENAAVVANCLDFSGLLRGVEALQMVDALLRDKEARPLLKASGNGDSGGGTELVSGPARLFLDRYLGRDVTVALVPPEKAGAKSTVLAVARTRMGFEEKMAEMASRYSPKVPLEREEYRGHTIHRYESDAPEQAFACCRFGRTVVASLFSSDAVPVRAMIDRKKDGGRSLMDAEAFVESAQWRAAERQMAVLIRPDGVGPALRNLPVGGTLYAKERFWLDVFEARNASTRWIALRAELNAGFHVNAEWRGEGDAAALDDGQLDQILMRLPRKSPLVLSVRSRELRQFFVDIYERLAASEFYARDMRVLEKVWRRWLGSGLRGEWLEKMSDGAGIAIAGLGGGIMPLPSAHFWWDFASAEQAQAAAKKVPSPKLGFGFARVDGATVTYDWNRAPVKKALPLSDSLYAHPLVPRPRGDFRGTWVGPALLLLVDLRSSYREIQGLESVVHLWSAGDRETYRELRRVFAVARHFQALRLTIEPTQDGGRAELLVAVE